MWVSSKPSKNRCVLPALALASTTSSILLLCSSALLEASNPHSRLFVNGFCRSPNHLWRSLAATSCPIAQPFPAFLRPSIKPVWKPSEPCFKRIWWPEIRLLPPAGCSTGRESPGSSSMWTGPGKPPANGLPSLSSLPAPHRRFDQVCAPGYLGRKRGEVVRTRTVILQAHTHQFLGTFGGPGNGDYRGELLRAIQVSTSYATKLALPIASVLLRLDGLYGDAAPLIDVLTAGLGVIARSRDYRLLDLEVVQQALARSPDQVSIHEDKWNDA